MYSSLLIEPLIRRTGGPGGPAFARLASLVLLAGIVPACVPELDSLLGGGGPDALSLVVLADEPRLLPDN